MYYSNAIENIINEYTSKQTSDYEEKESSWQDVDLKRWRIMTEEKDHEIFVSIVGGKARGNNVLDRNRLVLALTYQGGHSTF